MNVYDFDNTIYDGETVVDFFFFCLKRKPGLIRFVPAVLSAWIKYRLCVVTMAELESQAEKYLQLFLEMAGEITGAVQAFWDANERKIKPFYAQLRREDDVIISGSCDFILDEICRRLNIRHCICSSVDFKTGRLRRICYREKKPALFRAEYPDAEIENFYSDSKNDLPMMRMAQNAYIVKGHKIIKVNVGAMER